MNVIYTVVEQSGIKGNNVSNVMDFDKVAANLKSVGCILNMEKMREALSYGFAIVIDEFKIELRAA